MADHDVIVIGAGVAGLTAGMAAASHGLSTLIIDRLGVGGQIVNVERIDNFPGFPDGISGIELGPALQEQAETAGAELTLDQVERLERDGAAWRVECAGGTFTAPAIIVATGSELKKLGVPGEEQFAGRGVSHCASCDGPLFRGERVLVAGGGDSAVQEALALLDHVEEVTLVHDRPEITAQAALADRLAETRIGVRPNTHIKEIRGETVMTSAVLNAGGVEEEVPAAGVFTYVGLAPNGALLDGIAERDADGRLVVDAQMRLSTPGLWAAGDVRSGSVCWLASAAGDGVTAAISVARSLKPGR